MAGGASNHGRVEDEELGGVLPFPKRKPRSDEHELDDEDLILVEEPASAWEPPENLAVTVPRAPAPSFTRVVADTQVEEDVAGDCLASIAEVASQTRLSTPRLSATLAPAVAAPRSSGRLPPVSSPPIRAASVPWARESRPSTPVFVHRSSPAPAAATSAPPPSVASLPSLPALPSSGSVAPVALPAGATEPTVILLRERPRTGWILGSAAIGAACAIAAMRLLGIAATPTAAPQAAPAPPAPLERAAAAPGPATTPEAPGPATTPAVPVPATTLAASGPATTLAVPVPATTLAASGPATTLAASRLAASPAPAAASSEPGPSAPAPTAATAVVRFGEEQGVAVPAPAAAASARASAAAAGEPARKPKPKAKPKARAAGSGPAMTKLPDGSCGLTSPAPPALSPPPPSPPPRRALTPEQQLAEAQLKASMK